LENGWNIGKSLSIPAESMMNPLDQLMDHEQHYCQKKAANTSSITDMHVPSQYLSLSKKIAATRIPAQHAHIRPSKGRIMAHTVVGEIYA
jgi:hypothetical protein